MPNWVREERIGAEVSRVVASGGIVPTKPCALERVPLVGPCLTRKSANTGQFWVF
jgi:hypothetical protein